MEDTPPFTPSPEPNPKASRVRDIMAKVVSSLGIIKINTPPEIDPKVIEKAEEVNKILDDLARVQKEFQSKLNPKLQEHVLGIIRPMERHLQKMQRVLQQQGRPVEISEGWLLKAKVWTQLRGKSLHEPTIMNHLVTHVISEVEMSIQKDFRVIYDYFVHRMEELNLSAEEKLHLQEKLKQPLDDLGQDVRNLALSPAKGTLKALEAWKTQVDSKRQEHHEAAFELIDRHLPRKYSP